METRTLTDDEGRRWAGSVMSGRFRGGEEHAEVVFVCEDTPSEPQRFTRLDTTPDEAASTWRGLDQEGVLRVFRNSEPV